MFIGLILTLPIFSNSQILETLVPIEDSEELVHFPQALGVIRQLPTENAPLVGNGIVVGRNACHIITNFHVAFGKSVNTETGLINLVDNISQGHQVIFHHGFKKSSGSFESSTIATVVEYADYNETPRGMLGDIALLKLEKCLGNNFQEVNFIRPAEKIIIPSGELRTLSLLENKDGKFSMVGASCLAWPATTVAGIFTTSCPAQGGASGSIVIQRDEDKKFKAVGILTAGNQYISQAIYASRINKFLDARLGEK